MDWIKAILDRHTDENGVVDKDAANAEIDKEFPKQAVVKKVYNDKAKEANDLQAELDEVKGNSTKVQDLQTELEDTKKQLQQVKTDTQVESALKDAGAKELDYLKYKLGELELDEDGKVKDLEAKITELKESQASFFEPAADDDADKGGEDPDTGKDEDTPPAGYKILDNALDQGKQASPEAAAAAEFERAVGLAPAAE